MNRAAVETSAITYGFSALQSMDNDRDTRKYEGNKTKATLKHTIMSQRVCIDD